MCREFQEKYTWLEIINQLLNKFRRLGAKNLNTHSKSSVPDAVDLKILLANGSEKATQIISNTVRVTYRETIDRMLAKGNQKLFLLIVSSITIS